MISFLIAVIHLEVVGERPETHPFDIMENDEGSRFDEMIDMKPDISCDEFEERVSRQNPLRDSRSENPDEDLVAQKSAPGRHKQSVMKTKYNKTKAKSISKNQGTSTETSYRSKFIDKCWLLKNAKLDEQGICRLTLGRYFYEGTSFFCS